MVKIKIVDFFEMNNFNRKPQIFIFNNVFLIKIKTESTGGSGGSTPDFQAGGSGFDS